MKSATLRRSALILSASALALAPLLTLSGHRPDVAWLSVAGCGAGGGGGSAGAGKWIGRGATGGAVDVELTDNRTIGGDYEYNQVSLGLSKKVDGANTFSLGMGWKSNTFEISPYMTSADYFGTKTEQTGGFGDLSLGWSRTFGDVGQWSGGLSFTLPTGQWDIKRNFSNADKYAPWLNPSVQPGSGHYGASASVERTFDKDWGLWLVGGSYSAAFARESECGSSSDPAVRYAQCQEDHPSALTWRLWGLRHNTSDDYHGAPGTSATQSDVVSAYAHAAIREETAMHSAGATLTVPLGPSRSWDRGPNGPGSLMTESQDIMLKLSYGVEISIDPRNYPLFFSIGLPFKLNSMLAGRDWNPGAPQNTILTAGIKATFF